MVNPSLTYEILLYLNSFYFGMFAACEFGMGLLKAVNLAYAENKLALDAGLMILLFVIETLRIYLGRKGNLSEHGLYFYGNMCFNFHSLIFHMHI